MVIIYSYVILCIVLTIAVFIVDYINGGRK
jgi:hypothetical protein